MKISQFSCAQMKWLSITPQSRICTYTLAIYRFEAWGTGALVWTRNILTSIITAASLALIDVWNMIILITQRYTAECYFKDVPKSGVGHAQLHSNLFQFSVPVYVNTWIIYSWNVNKENLTTVIATYILYVYFRHFISLYFPWRYQAYRHTSCP